MKILCQILKLSTFIFFSIAAGAVAATEHSIKVGVYASGIVSKTDAKSIVKEMNKIMQGTGIPECMGVSFTLDTGPEKFATDLPKAVTSQSDFDKFTGSPYSINVVSQILHCGKHTLTGGQSFGGCTRRGAKPVLVTPTLSGAAKTSKWLHELGHSQGLSDRCRSDCSAHEGFVMAGKTGPNTKLSLQECLAFADDQNFPIIEFIPVSSERIDEDYLSTEYIHGLPPEPILEASDEDILFVRGIVQEGSDDLLPNAVLVLGLIGDRGDEDLLNEVINRSGSSFALHTAKLNSVIALGYLFNRFEERGTFANLIQFQRPSSNFQYFEGVEDFDVLEELGKSMSRNALLAIGMAELKNGSFAPEILGYLNDQQSAQEAGAYDINVDDSFFEGISQMRSRTQRIGIRSLFVQPPDTDR